MRLLPLLFVASNAFAFTEPDSGAWLGAGGGLAIDSHSPFGIGPGWQLSGGFWFGKHDNAYAIGKYTGIGVTARQSLLRGELVTEPMLEVRYGADIVVVTTQLFASVGPQFRAGDVGVSALVGGGLKYRMTARFGITGRLGVGASFIDGTPGFRSDLTFGVEWASPWERRE